MRPTVIMSCATGRESNPAPPTGRRLGHNAGTNRQPNRRDFVFDRQVAFSDGSVPHDDISVVPRLAAIAKC